MKRKQEWMKMPAIHASGTGAIGSKTIGATVTTDQKHDASGAALCRFTSNGHKINAKSHVIIAGCVSPGNVYNGLRYVSAVATNTFDIRCNNFISSYTPAGTETVKFGLIGDGNRQFRLTGFRAAVGVAASTAENLTITVDADLGSAWDRTIYTKAMAGVTSLNQTFREYDEFFEPNDIVYVAWTNTDGRTWSYIIDWELKV